MILDIQHFQCALGTSRMEEDKNTDQKVKERQF